MLPERRSHKPAPALEVQVAVKLEASLPKLHSLLSARKLFEAARS
jgi:hypothetical protein